MTTETLNLLISTLGPIILAIVVYYTGRQANRNAKRAAMAAETVQGKLDDSTSYINRKLDTIHILVNSRLTQALDKIDRLELRIQALTGEPPTGEPNPVLRSGTVEIPPLLPPPSH